jgi:heat shock protein beta
MEKNINGKYITRLRLYIKRVLITEEFEDFLPRYLCFVRGVIDSDDLPLNISREMLQESKMLRMIARKIVRRVLQMMADVAAESKEEEDLHGDTDDDEDTAINKYRKFYRDYAQNIKIGCIEDRENRKKLSKLLRFNTTLHEDKEISLDDYIAQMKKGQTEIYYIAGDPAASTIQRSPFLLPYKKKGYDVLFFSDPIDEVVAREMRTYEGKPLISITETDKNKAESEREKERIRIWKQTYKPLTTWFKQLLKTNVTRVDVSTRLAVDTKSPCVLSSAEGSVSANIERLMREQAKMDSSLSVQESKKVLELNPRSDLIKRMNKALVDCRDKDPDGCDDSKDMEKLRIMGILMYETSLLDGGYIVYDSALYADHVFEVLTKMTGLPHAPVLPGFFCLFASYIVLFYKMIYLLISKSTDAKKKKKNRKH